ncbi:DNA adenine methylase [Pedobacter sp. LMG 31464]|uniref:site-specific DNA-methyltransferase (adenine-specific) n=1 Tax=Pedobacter planticolens TaxID=2679964 RepID=A0A923IUK3_9SPHI|nr:DNA adenine methylase [Pedobacter planticolens]MBB2144976.1 DNA adenine methylase [Pedobacter planticolens]
MNNKLRPIIKWTGGKYSEFALFSEFIPEFDRYIEPFFGGGGVFFALQPKVQSFINDKSTDLINFYKQIDHKEFKTELFNYATAWDELGNLTTKLWNECAIIFASFIQKNIPSDQLNDALLVHLTHALKAELLLNNQDFIIDIDLFKKMLLASMADKARRIKRICEKEGRNFNNEELKSHFETGIRSGAYLFFRALLNKQYTQTLQLKPAKAAANWYFVREFCYGSMFRFNAKGEFNIPYGGIAYNRKNFRQKAENIFDVKVTELFKHTSIFNLDFEAFLNQLELKTTDFIFLDPPYDSEFSEYDQSAFTQSDQQRLATFLIQNPAKWMVVIKETEFIRKIYTHSKVKITTFSKSYTYNVRGRNNRDATHLIITNY